MYNYRYKRSNFLAPPAPRLHCAALLVAQSSLNSQLLQNSQILSQPILFQKKLLFFKNYSVEMILLFHITICFCAFVALVESSEKNNWPIIGLFTQPTSSTAGNCKGKCVYVAASYVKHLESAGARVVPIDYYASTADLDELFSSLNGFFFPGGSSSFPSSAQYVYDKVVAANKQGDFMPLWGVCMGFQWLLIAQSKDANILDPASGQMDSYNISLPLDFTLNATSSKLFGTAPDALMKIYSTQNVTMNNHHYGIYPDHFYATNSLASFFNVLSTNKDRQGVEFISTMESFDYPIFGTQWHPEKNNFEWGQNEDGSSIEAINHSEEAIWASQYTTDFFVRQARLNSHKFSSPQQERDALIWNYPVTYTADSSSSFVEEYFFNF